MLNVIQIPNLLSRTKKAYKYSVSPELIVTPNPLKQASIYPRMSVYLNPISFAITPLKIIAATSDVVEAYRFL